MSRRNVQEPIFLDLHAKPNSGNAVVTASELATSNSKMRTAFAKVKEIADEMRYHAKINRKSDERNKAHTWLSIEAGVYDEYADRIDEAIKEFV